MKRLIFIGGPMGAGKTSVAKIIQQKLPNTVYLDGDWCWFSNPWILNDETRQMVLENIVFLLNNFIKTKSYQYIVFTWILYDKSITKEITSKLLMKDVDFYHFSLVAEEDEIVRRLKDDLASGIRTEEVVIPRSLARLKQIRKMTDTLIDTTNMDINQVADLIIKEIE